jgi:hypothetical protein
MPSNPPQPTSGLSPVPPVPTPGGRTAPLAGIEFADFLDVELAAFLELAVDEPGLKDFERSLEAVRRRREFRLIHGTKTQPKPSR